MVKFGVIQIIGDSVRTLRLCQSKEEAIAFSKAYQEERRRERGVICAVSGDFNENDKLKQNRFRLY